MITIQTWLMRLYLALLKNKKEGFQENKDKTNDVEVMLKLNVSYSSLSAYVEIVLKSKKPR